MEERSTYTPITPLWRFGNGCYVVAVHTDDNGERSVFLCRREDSQGQCVAVSVPDEFPENLIIWLHTLAQNQGAALVISVERLHESRVVSLRRSE